MSPTTPCWISKSKIKRIYFSVFHLPALALSLISRSRNVKKFPENGNRKLLTVLWKVNSSQGYFWMSPFLKCFLSFVVDEGTYSITFIAYISPQVILKSGFELEFDHFGSICPSAWFNSWRDIFHFRGSLNHRVNFIVNCNFRHLIK